MRSTPIERRVSSLLLDISQDVIDLSAHASAIDSIASVIDATLANNHQRQALQRIDEIFQHLEDISVILREVGASVGPEVLFDSEQVASKIRLDYLKSRVVGKRIDPDEHFDSGEIDLF